ncbi:hypothetical protein E2F50_20010 [Rhizobium deserti]|uniref:Uncharacterized protein n=1 Tax=Rhizobium deserti TaxID=2547961 RepID=A0A4V3ANH3_9HYPH|nr:hypothetical protein [Rhizobium deserti]TDK31238.1 hypothetical protein E2F50_20010 [Rhizobium deserti]
MPNSTSPYLPSQRDLRRTLEQMAWHFSPDKTTMRALVECTIAIVADDPFNRQRLPIDEALFLTMRRAFQDEFSRARVNL